MLPARRRSATPFVLAAAVVMAGACGGGGEAAEQPGRRAGTTSIAPAEPTSGPSSSARPSELLAFSAPAIGGGVIDASVHQGRPVLLWFWSPW